MAAALAVVASMPLRDDVVPRLAAHENTAHRARSTDAQCRIPPLDLNLRRISEVGPVAFAGVDDEDTGPAGGREHLRTWTHSDLET